MLEEYKIKGLRIERFIQKIEEKYFIENKRYIFNCIKKKRNYEILLYFNYINEKEKKAIFEIKEVKCFCSTSYLPIQIFSITLDIDKKAHYNQAFDFDDTTINIKYENFKKTNRLKEKRPVWIFKGKSGLGKSYLASIIFNNSNLTIYETDSSSKLSDKIYEDIVIIGNKYNYSIEDIEKNIYGEHESIIINFDKKA